MRHTEANPETHVHKEGNMKSYRKSKSPLYDTPAEIRERVKVEAKQRRQDAYKRACIALQGDPNDPTGTEIREVVGGWY